MMPAASRLAIGAVAPLDLVRATLLRWLGRAGRVLFVDRGVRVALYAVVGVVLAFLLVIAAPLWLLALGPVVLGVPHLVADARYLVARQGLHRRPGFWLLVAAPLCLTFPSPSAATGLLAVVGATLVAKGTWLRRVLVLGPAVGAMMLAAHVGWTADVVAAHAHNAMALALWWAWAPRRSAGRGIALALFGAMALSILAGAFDRLGVAAIGPGISLREMVRTLSPVRDPVWGLRLVLCFAFAQSVHYAVWLRLIPEEDRPRPGMRPFASSLRAIRADIGTVALVAGIAATVALAAWACFDPHAARLSYLRVALFHAPLEWAIVAILLIERRPLKTA